MIRRLEVRCCCNPVKLLGHIQIAEAWIAGGRRDIHFPRRDAGPITLTLELFSDGNEDPYLAVKSNDYTIDELRQIRAFEPLVPVTGTDSGGR